jgi:hypothetical protein
MGAGGSAGEITGAAGASCEGCSPTAVSAPAEDSGEAGAFSCAGLVPATDTARRIPQTMLPILPLLLRSIDSSYLLG